MREKVCIVCSNPVYGKKAVRVKEDLVLKTIRNIKRALKTAKENELYVCEEDLKKNQEKRNEFVKNMLIFGIVAVFVFFLSLFSSFLGGAFNLTALVFGIFVAIVIILLAVITKYNPGVESEQPILIENKEGILPEKKEEKVAIEEVAPKGKRRVRKWQK